ncbi:MAG: hypothetical protein RL095_1770 [Verrucomicrobiota bacterium]|jgi:integrase
MKLYRRKLKSGLSRNYSVRLRIKDREIRLSTGQSTYAEAKAWVERHVQPLKEARHVAALEKAAQQALAAAPLPLLDERGQDLPARNQAHAERRLKHRQSPGYVPRKEVKRPSAWICFLQAHPSLSANQQQSCLGSLRSFAAWVSKSAEEKLSTRRRLAAGVHVAAITQEHARDWLRSLQAEGLAGVTLRRHRQRLLRIFDAAAELAGIRRNPFREAAAPAADGASRRAFSPDELRQILAESAKEEIGPLVAIAVCTGLRLGDAVTLRWDEIDIHRNCFRRITSKTRTEVEIPILPPLAAWLQGRKDKDKTGLLLPDLAALYRSRPGEISSRFGKLLDRLGIRRKEALPGRARPVTVKSFHALRHSFVYLAAEAQVPLPVIVAIVGHSSARMTERYAAHTTLEAKQKLLEKVGISRLFGAE